MILTHGANSLNMGGEPMEYVQIDSLLWTTKNLDLDLGTEGVNQITHPWPNAGKLYTLDVLLNNLTLDDGWRIPTNADYTALRDYVISHGSGANGFQKLTTTDNEYNGYQNGTDEFGFNALITGYSTTDSVPNISAEKNSCNFWTQTNYSGNSYYDWCLQGGNNFSALTHNKNNYLLCCRLCKDA